MPFLVMRSARWNRTSGLSRLKQILQDEPAKADRQGICVFSSSTSEGTLLPPGGDHEGPLWIARSRCQTPTISSSLGDTPVLEFGEDVPLLVEIQQAVISDVR